ncbi:MAG: hypothetical protein EXR75_01635 [Myxococcales bacterium]|nr:hypothetical protein [Myxococcales bacterium]
MLEREIAAHPPAPATLGAWPMVAASLLGAASISLELASFRLDAAIVGRPYAWLVALLVPALAGFVTAVAAARSGGVRPTRDAQRASAAALVAGAGAVAAAVVLPWMSQMLGKKDAVAWAICLPVVAWAAAQGGIAAALGFTLRAERGRLGRVGLAFGVGGAAGALLVPLAMSIGAPRTLLVIGVACALAAIALARSARGDRQSSFALVTLPLALVALFIGDLRVPWLRVRTDAARRGRVGHSIWSPLGVIAVDPQKQKDLEFTVDQLDPTPIYVASKGKASFAITDLGYALAEATVGALLVVHSGGAREIGVGRREGHERVDAIEPSADTLAMLAQRYDREADGLLRGSDRGLLKLGDGRGLAALGTRYQRILLVGAGSFEQAAPRFLHEPLRRHSLEALRESLAVLDEPRGLLMVRTPKEGLDDLLATLAVAAGGIEVIAERVVACSEREPAGAALAILRGGKLGAPERERLIKECKRRGLVVELTPDASSQRAAMDAAGRAATGATGRGDRKRDEKERAQSERLERVLAASVITDEHPYPRPPKMRRLLSAAREELVSLWAFAKDPKRRHPSAPSVATPAPANGGAEVLAVPIGLAAIAIGASLSCALLLLALFLPISGNRAEKPGICWRIAIALFGMASSFALVASADHALRLFGSPAASWSLVVPLGLVGTAVGRAAADMAVRSRVASHLARAAIFGVVALGALGFVLSPLAGVLVLAPTARIAVAALILIFAGAAVACAATLSLRLIAPHSSAALGWGVGVELVGVAAGAGLAQLAVRTFAVTPLFLLAAALVGVASALAWFGTRQLTSVGRTDFAGRPT